MSFSFKHMHKYSSDTRPEKTRAKKFYIILLMIEREHFQMSQIFEHARKLSSEGVLIFVDEIDSLAG